MHRVSAVLMGGLGNYMFQIAAAYSYGIKHNKALLLTSSNSMVKHQHISTYQDNVLHGVNIDTASDTTSYVTYNESEFSYKEIPYIHNNVRLHGYFQSEKYFQAQKVKALFQYPQKMIHDAVNKHGHIGINYTCSIHVRRGDYLKLQDIHPTQTVDYYKSAVALMPRDTTFLVFSDDIEWCKIHLNSLGNIVFIQDQTDYEDMLLMSLCDHNIICNSSFSWWGAWLNNNENKMVVAPHRWFGPAYSNHETGDLYCKGWIKL